MVLTAEQRKLHTELALVREELNNYLIYHRYLKFSRKLTSKLRVGVISKVPHPKGISLALGKEYKFNLRKPEQNQLQSAVDSEYSKSVKKINELLNTIAEIKARII
jgi:hypothetical protein